MKQIPIIDIRSCLLLIILAVLYVVYRLFL
ncbi:hypothetical protein DES38_103216 [Streptohalobacillus salinus]|uniref:Uncharacterized protein n=1 Tax=Streptohalobacillus salinus TaxID=621096 RepID=A0A2V3WID7_9BACI|nr:hypothetical protein DES38_103216 [Streptohalobacillus salinus]